MAYDFTTIMQSSSIHKDNSIPKSTPKYWTIDEEKELVLNYKSTNGDLKTIASRHGRTQRAIDMRLTKIIKDMKSDNMKASDVFQLFGGHMSQENFNDRWESQAIVPASSGAPHNNSTQNMNLLLKYMTDAEEKLQMMEKRMSTMESQLTRIIKLCKKSKSQQ
jgi:hypothetical protein